jgi:hypothetical protein
MVGIVEVAEADDALLHVLGKCGDGQCKGQAGGGQ